MHTPTRSVMVEYFHQLKEDLDDNILRSGICLRTTSTPDKLQAYPAFNGLGFVVIAANKVQVVRRTTTIETMMVEAPITKHHGGADGHLSYIQHTP